MVPSATAELSSFTSTCSFLWSDCRLYSNDVFLRYYCINKYSLAGFLCPSTNRVTKNIADLLQFFLNLAWFLLYKYYKLNTLLFIVRDSGNPEQLGTEQGPSNINEFLLQESKRKQRWSRIKPWRGEPLWWRGKKKPGLWASWRDTNIILKGVGTLRASGFFKISLLTIVTSKGAKHYGCHQTMSSGWPLIYWFMANSN